MPEASFDNVGLIPMGHSRAKIRTGQTPQSHHDHMRNDEKIDQLPFD
jgi:hypothetical protein